MSTHMMAVPEFHHFEIVNADTQHDLRTYVEKQKDDRGQRYKKCSLANKKIFGYDYTSAQGAVKIEVYTPPKVKKI